MLNLVQAFHGTNNTQFEWETEFNKRVKPNGEPVTDYNKGWYYIRDGQLHFSQGQKGHFIYQTLMERIQEKSEQWIVEYLIDNAK